MTHCNTELGSHNISLQTQRDMPYSIQKPSGDFQTVFWGVIRDSKRGLQKSHGSKQAAVPLPHSNLFHILNFHIIFNLKGSTLKKREEEKNNYLF